MHLLKQSWKQEPPVAVSNSGKETEVKEEVNESEVIGDKEKVAEITKDSEEEISIEDFYDINNSSLFKCKSETFSICKLMKCFINYCKLVFE